MKKFLSAIWVAIALCGFAVAAPAWAGNAAAGAKIFSDNCASCHVGGTNAINPSKTLQKADLKQHRMNSVKAIKTQVSRGKKGMPAFGDKLTDSQIEDVAVYVLRQAKRGW